MTACSAPPGRCAAQRRHARWSGSIEGSNVNSVETMVGMIAASRQFEQQMKLLQTAETNDKAPASC
jgi:flagellar basal body rod protein FlgF